MAAFRNPFGGMKGLGTWFSNLFTSRPKVQSTQANPASEQPKTAEELMQSAMAEAMQLTDMTETGIEKVFSEVIALACYIGPFIIAPMVGGWIGDGLSALTHANASDAGLYHSISIGLELFVPISSLGCAKGIKRIQVDREAMGLMIASVLCFVSLAAGSALAQWYIYTAPYGDHIPLGIIVVSIFKGVAPIIADVASTIYLSLHGYKSLKKKLAQLDERTEAVQKIFQKQAAIVDQSDKQKKEREDAEAERARRNEKERMIDKVYDMMGNSFMGLLESYLHAGASSMNGTAKQQRTGGYN